MDIQKIAAAPKASCYHKVSENAMQFDVHLKAKSIGIRPERPPPHAASCIWRLLNSIDWEPVDGSKITINGITVVPDIFRP